MKLCGFAAVIRDKLAQKGRLYLGSSAGAIVCGPSIDFIGDLDDKSKANLDDYEGLGLVDFCFVPHSESDTFGPAIKEIIADLKNNNRKAIALRDDQALYIENNCMEIY